MAENGLTGFHEFYDYDRSKKIIDATEKDLNQLLEILGKVNRTLKTFSNQYAKSLDSTTKAMQKNNAAIKSLDKTQVDSLEVIVKTTQENEKLAKSGRDLKGSIDGINESSKQLGKSVNDQKTRLAQLKAEFNSLDPTISKDSKRLKELSSEIIKVDKYIKDMSKATRDANNVLTRVTGSYNSLTAAIKRDLDVLKNIPGATDKSSAAYKKNRKEIEALQSRIKSNTEQLKKFDAEIGRNFRNVGNYGTAFRAAAGTAKQFAGALGFTGIVFGLANAFKQAFTTIRDFQKQNATLAGVLNTTRDNTNALTNDALQLGATTAKTASEVTELQIAYARLGFTQQEILDLTGDTINGSIALNANLAETAELTGAVIETFNDLSTMDADIVLDQLTASTQRSALNFEKLQTALPIVAGAANAAGVPFTKLLALLGKLSDAGIDASSSATALRNIFIESRSQGLDYSQVLEKINEDSDQLTASTDEFGKRAAVSSTILSNLSSEVETLDISLQNAAGTAARVAAVELDTLDGSIKLLSSAWEGFILSIENGDGVLAKIVRGSLDGLASVLNSITTESKNLVEPLEAQRREFIALTNALINLNPEKQEAAELINKLNSEYKDYLPNLLSEKTSIDDIRKAQEAANETFLKTILLKQQEEQLSKIAETQVALARKVLDAQREQGDIIRKNQKLEEEYNQAVGNGNIERAKQIDQEFQFNAERSDELGKNIEEYRELQKAGTDSSLALQEGFEALKEELGLIGGSQKAVKRSAEDINKTYEKLPTDIFGDQKLQSKELVTVLATIPSELDKVEKKTESSTSKMKEFWKEWGESIKEAATGAYDIASTALNQFFTNSQINRENDFALFEESQNEQIKKLEERRERELEISGTSAEARDAINRKYNTQIQRYEDETAKKQKELRVEQAKSEKKQAIFNTILNTAQAITKTIATLGLPAAIPFVISAAAIGAAQTIAVASQPLPKFEHGTNSSPDGPIMVNDGKRGNKVKRELITTPQGKQFFFDTDRPVITEMIPKGSKIDPRDISDLTNLSSRIKDYSPVVGRHAELQRNFESKVSEQKKLITINNNHSIDYDKLGQAVARNLPSTPLIEFLEDGTIRKSVINGNTKRITGHIDILKNSNLAKQLKKLSK